MSDRKTIHLQPPLPPTPYEAAPKVKRIQFIKQEAQQAGNPIVCSEVAPHRITMTSFIGYVNYGDNVIAIGDTDVRGKNEKEFRLIYSKIKNGTSMSMDILDSASNPYHLQFSSKVCTQHKSCHIRMKILLKMVPFQMPAFEVIHSICHSCDGSMENRLATFYPTDPDLELKLSERKKHIRSSHTFGQSYDCNLVYFQNGHQLGLQFDVQMNSQGYLAVSKVVGNLDMDVNSILLMFNGFDLRGKDKPYLENLMKKYKYPSTICKALLVKEPFPKTVLSVLSKVHN